MSCAVKTCKNARRFASSDISFYNFPKGDLQKEWLRILGITDDNWIWTKNKVICSEHFRDTDFYIPLVGRKTLKDNAIPSIKLEVPLRKLDILGDSHSTLGSSLDISIASTSTADQSVTIQSSTSSLTDESQRRIQLKKKRKLESSIKDVSSSSTATDSSTKRRRIKFVSTIHSYSTSPNILKYKHEKLRQKQVYYRKQLYNRNKQITLLKQKVNNMQTVIQYLRKNSIISTNAADHLEMTYENIPKLLINRYLKNIRNGTITHETYPPMLRQFAATLQFYSNKAYEEVRKQFEMALPHPVTIRKWYKNIDCQPGFISTAFEVLRLKADESRAAGRKLLCSLILDEMSIRKQIEFDGNETWGYVNIGVPNDSDNLLAATEALVLLVVSHQSHWKIPIAYFFIVTLSGEEKANIVTESLIRLNDVGVTITSVTCDGPVANFSMLKSLGCDFSDIHNLKTYFTHPADISQKVFCILDGCHMIKLMRNNFAMLNNFQDPEGNVVSWNFIKKLYEIQENEGLRISNKLRKAHMEWSKQKMKVYLAAQTLSRSVADAIEFLDVNMGLIEFAGSRATVNFIKKVDNLFDILNSRSPQAKGYKAPLRRQTEHLWRPFVNETVEYFLRCTDIAGRPLWLTAKKTPWIGFSITALSVCGIFDSFIAPNDLQYLLTYKLSQDHLETFFSSVRSRNGWNNNPTCLQFMRTFKRLLLHTKISGHEGNCKVLDTTTVLHVPSTNIKPVEEFIDMTLLRKYTFEPDSYLMEHDYDIVSTFFDISVLSLNIVVYISGFVVKTLKKVFKCPECLESCESPAGTLHEDSLYYDLLRFKNRGGLHSPSSGVVKICRKVEITLRRLLQKTNNKIPKDRYFIQVFVLGVAQNFYEEVFHLFPILKDHFLEMSPIDENHRFLLIKSIVHTYLKIRIYNLCKRYTETIQGTLVRRELNKLILFNHQ